MLYQHKCYLDEESSNVFPFSFGPTSPRVSSFVLAITEHFMCPEENTKMVKGLKIKTYEQQLRIVSLEK